METNKHVSFDVWNTLVAANPMFAANRTKMLSGMFGVAEDVVKQKYTNIKRHSDGLAESSGVGFTHFTLVYRLIESITHRRPTNIQVTQVCDGIADLFEKHPPIITASTIDMIKQLTDSGITVSIGSNSNFITGRVMHPWLNRVVGDRLLFGVYSDIVEVSKPAAAFFGHIIDNVRHHRSDHVCVGEIIHVGDNLTCDMWGASEIGMGALLVPSPDLTHEIVSNYVKGCSHV